jgi:hypothetical protein
LAARSAALIGDGSFALSHWPSSRGVGCNSNWNPHVPK